MAQGKKYQNAARGYDREHLHSIDEAATIVAGFPKRNYDETVDMVLRLGVCLLYTSPSPRDATLSRMPSSA